MLFLKLWTVTESVRFLFVNPSKSELKILYPKNTQNNIIKESGSPSDYRSTEARVKTLLQEVIQLLETHRTPSAFPLTA